MKQDSKNPEDFKNHEIDFQKAVKIFESGDIEGAVEIWSRLAHQGHPASQHDMGMYYHNRKSDFKNAYKWFLRSAEQDNPESQIMLFHMHSHGQGVEINPQNEEEGCRWCWKAAMQNLADAQFMIAVHFVTGKGVQQDFPMAYAWFTIAIENENEFSKDSRDKLETVMTEEDLDRAKEIYRMILNTIPKKN